MEHRGHHASWRQNGDAKNGGERAQFEGGGLFKERGGAVAGENQGEEAARARFPGEHGSYDLYSFGRDGTLGGDGENKDVVNW